MKFKGNVFDFFFFLSLPWPPNKNKLKEKKKNNRFWLWSHLVLLLLGQECWGSFVRKARWWTVRERWGRQGGRGGGRQGGKDRGREGRKEEEWIRAQGLTFRGTLSQTSSCTPPSKIPVGTQAFNTRAFVEIFYIWANAPRRIISHTYQTKL